jgi:hypothetical protein
MRFKFLSLVFLVIFLLTGCLKVNDDIEPTKASPMISETEAPGLGYPIEPEVVNPATAYPISEGSPVMDLVETTTRVVQALGVKDLEQVAAYVHPEMGVRFSPYTYVETSHQVFMPAELPGLVGSEQIHLWGSYDGTGDPIELTFDEYFDRFVYSADFANAEAMAVDEELGHSSMINNIADFYPGSAFVEYHFSGFDEAYGGMDWVSLRLVFIQEEGTWYLVGIVHDQWTI